MKGIIHLFEVDQRTKGCGQFRAVDVEDIIAVNRRPTLSRS